MATVRHWLMKSEPEGFSIEDLRRRGTSPWDGVRNYQARNYMRDMQVGDHVLFYHSNANPSGVAGLAQVARTAYPDHTSWDPEAVHFDSKSTPEAPRWDMVDLRYVRAFERFLALDELRQIHALADMPLFKRSRLSVQPVTADQFACILALAGS